MSRKPCEYGCTCGKHSRSRNRTIEYKVVVCVVCFSNIEVPPWKANQKTCGAKECISENKRRIAFNRSFEQQERMNQRNKEVRSIIGKTGGVKKWTRGRGFYMMEGYIDLTRQEDHPLSSGDGGCLLEHRKVLWEKLVCESLDCEHSCHWCGKILNWRDGKQGICADHLDTIRDNNDANNLVVSCMSCNAGRKWRA